MVTLVVGGPRYGDPSFLIDSSQPTNLEWVGKRTFVYLGVLKNIKVAASPYISLAIQRSVNLFAQQISISCLPYTSNLDLKTNIMF